MHRIAILLLAVGVSACQSDGGPDGWNGSLQDLMESQPDRFGRVLEDPDGYRLQIIYTQIDRDAANRPTFRSFSYRLDAREYFYPASTVKLPVAALALEKINRLNRPRLDRDSVMLTGVAADFQTEATVEDTSATGLPSVAQYIRKIFLVSDNDAFNRLYEFLGQEELNEALRRKGYTNARIIHRLELALDTGQNQSTNPIRFIRGDETVYSQPAAKSVVSYAAGKPELLGSAEIVDGRRLERPKDFAAKNAFPLQDLHDTVVAIMFPEHVAAERRFVLTDDDYRFLRRCMSEYPDESGIAAYADTFMYPQAYVKFLMYGGSAETIPGNIRIFNKVGDAYGFLTDAAYIVDFDNRVEFLLAATIYTNANQTFNDNDYEYGEIGLPFLRDLGLAIYEVELARSRGHDPDFTALLDLRRDD